MKTERKKPFEVFKRMLTRLFCKRVWVWRVWQKQDLFLKSYCQLETNNYTYSPINAKTSLHHHISNHLISSWYHRRCPKLNKTNIYTVVERDELDHRDLEVNSTEEERLISRTKRIPRKNLQMLKNYAWRKALEMVDIVWVITKLWREAFTHFYALWHVGAVAYSRGSVSAVLKFQGGMKKAEDSVGNEGVYTGTAQVIMKVIWRLNQLTLHPHGHGDFGDPTLGRQSVYQMIVNPSTCQGDKSYMNSLVILIPFSRSDAQKGRFKFSCWKSIIRQSRVKPTESEKMIFLKITSVFWWYWSRLLSIYPPSVRQLTGSTTARVR